MRCDLIRALPTVMWVCDCGQMKCWGSNFQTVTCTFETVNIVWNSSRSRCPSVSDVFLSSITLSSCPSRFICLSQGLLLLTGQLLRCLRSQSLRPPAWLWPYLHVNRISAKVRTVATPIQRSVHLDLPLQVIEKQRKMADIIDKGSFQHIYTSIIIITSLAADERSEDSDDIVWTGPLRIVYSQTSDSQHTV